MYRGLSRAVSCSEVICDGSGDAPAEVTEGEGLPCLHVDVHSHSVVQ